MCEALTNPAGSRDENSVAEQMIHLSFAFSHKSLPCPRTPSDIPCP